jgi:hypothetical protein
VVYWFFDRNARQSQARFECLVGSFEENSESVGAINVVRRVRPVCLCRYLSSRWGVPVPRTHRSDTEYRSLNAVGIPDLESDLYLVGLGGESAKIMKNIFSDSLNFFTILNAC